MATKDGRSQIWYADGNGNVEGYTETIDDVIETIIGTYNEHFGTDIQIWTPETETLQVGDTVPNWYAYEKIEIPAQKIAVKIPGGGNTGLMCGTLSNKVFDMLTNGNGCLVASVNGIVQNYNGPGVGASDYIIGLLSNYNLEATEVVQTIVDYEVGAAIPNWQNYEIVE